MFACFCTIYLLDLFKIKHCLLTSTYLQQIAYLYLDSCVCLSTAQPSVSHPLLLPYCIAKSLPFSQANPNQRQFPFLSALPTSAAHISEFLCLPPFNSSLHLGQTLTSWPAKDSAEWCLNRVTAPSQMDDSEGQEKKM